MTIRRLNTIRRLQEALDDIYSSTENQILEEENIEENKIKFVLSEEGKALLKDKEFKASKCQNNNICPILNCDFVENQKITILPCNHIFDHESINNWLNNEKAECPVCRYKLPSKEINFKEEENFENNYLDEESNSDYDIEELGNSLAFQNDIHLLRSAFRIAFQNLTDDYLNR